MLHNNINFRHFGVLILFGMLFLRFVEQQPQAVLHTLNNNGNGQFLPMA